MVQAYLWECILDYKGRNNNLPLYEIPELQT